MTAPKFFPTAAAFRHWLDANASSAAELLVGFHKVGSGQPSMSWSESVDEALCVGWIDGVRKRVDDASYTIRFTPRKPVSHWSAVNIAKMERLQAEGRMTPAGTAAFARRTEARSRLASYERETPAVLEAAELRAFKRERPAWRFFDATPPGYRNVMLHWVCSAKRPETRAARLTKLIAACAAGQRLR